MTYSADDSALWLERCLQRAKYGEPPRFNVWYLDTDAKAAAAAHCDAHVGQGVRQYAQLLSTAWHWVAGDLVEFEWTNTDTRLLGHIDDEPGGYHTLGGQRIFKPVPSGLVDWVCETQGSYDWLWRCAQHLAQEHRARFKRAHPAEVVLWALECPPSALPAGGATQPAPRLPEALCAHSDGVYDTVGSYRAAYVVLCQRMLRWTRRPAPPWLRRVHGGLYDLR